MPPVFRVLLLSAALAAALAGAPGAEAQPRAVWRRLEGLPGASTTAVLRDREGFLWVGTHFGLVRTDGEAIEVFRPRAGDPGALAGATVNVGALLEARDGALWVGTSEGLCRRLPASRRFTCVGHVPTDPASLADGNVTAVAESPDGTVWAGTTHGLHAVDPSTLRARRFGRADGLPHDYVTAVAVAPDGTVWVGTRSGLVVRPPGAAAFQGVRGLPADVYPYVLRATPRGAVWVGTFGHGLYSVAGPAAAARAVPLVASAPPGEGGGVAPGARSGSSQVVALHGDLAGGLWVGTWGAGLYRYDPATGAAVQFVARPGDADGLPSDEVVGLETDAEGGVWAATWDGLAYHVPPAPYRLLTHDPADPASLSSPRVTSLLRGPTGELWVGTFDRGLNRCDPSTLRCRQYRHDPADPASLCGDFVFDLALDAGGALWVGTGGHGVCRLDPATDTFAPALPHAPPALNSANVYAVAFDGAGAVWLGTVEEGLVRVPLRPEGGPALQSLGDHQVYTLARTGAGEIWAGTLGDGVCWMGGAGGEDQPACLRSRRGLVGDLVTTLTPVSGGLWIGGANGLDRVPVGEGGRGGARGRPRNVLTEAELPQPHVACVLPTPNGLWVSTGSGILRLDPRSSRITHDAAAVGLPRWGFLREACAPLGPYLLAFGSQDGVVLFRPSDVTRVRRLPTRLTALLVDGREFAPGVPAHRLRSLTLRPTQGGPTFRFATLGATRARRYVYRLDGYDRAWSQPTDRAEAVYPKLPPGRYTFRVRPAFQSAAAEATVRLVVRAPVWRRAWFLALSALLAVALGVAAHRARVAYLLRIERTRRQIADDLHDALGSRTGALALQLEIAAAAPGLPEEAQRRLARAAEDTRLLAAEVHEMVWIVDGGHESVAALMERMEGVAHELLPGRPHRVRVVGEGPDCVLPPRYRRHLLLALREAVHNAARHAEAEHIDIVIEGRAAGLAFEVGDDGRGFDPDAPVGIERAGPGGRGLRTMRARAEAVGGRLEVTSAPGQGTRVRFEAPCPRSGGTLRGGG